MIVTGINFTKVTLIASILAIGGGLGGRVAHAQIVTAGSIPMPSASFGVGSVQGFTGSFLGIPFALPATVGSSVEFTAFRANGVVSFVNLPINGSGSGIASGLNFPVILELDGVTQPAINISASAYTYQVDLNSTTTSILPGNPANFSYMGASYRVTLNTVSVMTGGNPPQVNISTVTGVITQISNGPEPGTFALVGLGLLGLAVRRRTR